MIILGILILVACILVAAVGDALERRQLRRRWRGAFPNLELKVNHHE